MVYILRNENFPVFLIAAYAKNDKGNLTKKERNELAKRSEEIFRSYGRSIMAAMFDDLMQGLDEVDAFLGGKAGGCKVNLAAEVDVKSIRKRLKMTQARFSDTFGFSLDAVKHWEGGRRIPEASARAFLTVIARNPNAVIEALHPQMEQNPRRSSAGRQAASR